MSKSSRSNHRPIKDPRAAAAITLAPILERRGSLSSLDDSAIPPRDRSFYRALCFGVCRTLPRLEALSSILLSKGFKQRDQDMYALFLLGLYQLIYMRVPGHAAVGETAGAARTLGKLWATKVLNACLRRYQREQEKLDATVDKRPECHLLHPKWLLDAINEAWPEEARDIIAANNTPAPMTLRVNRAKSTRSSALAALADAELEASACQDAIDGITLVHPTDVGNLPGFTEGKISVQDESAQLAATMLMDAILPNASQETPLRILDACSAPGGKTMHIIECAMAKQQAIHLIALDNDEHRLTRVREGITRIAPSDNIRVDVIEADAAGLDWWDEVPFDAILLDAPCSGTGVIRRHPDIKTLRTPKDINALAQLQESMLDILWSSLKEGGAFLYATCSIMPKENDQQVSAFQKNTPDAKNITPETGWGIKTSCGCQRLPEEGGSDGFFYSLMQKVQE